MSFQLPPNLPIILQQPLAKVTNGSELTEVLDKKSIALPFFQFIQTKTWESNLFLRGRICELAETHYLKDQAVRTKSALCGDGGASVFHLPASLSFSEEKSRFKMDPNHVKEDVIFNTFINSTDFFHLIDTNRFAAGCIFERMHLLYGLDYKTLRHDLNKESFPLGPQETKKETLERLQKIYNLAPTYAQKAELTCDDKGFYEFLKFRLCPVESGVYSSFEFTIDHKPVRLSPLTDDRVSKLCIDRLLQYTFDLLLRDLSKLSMPWGVKSKALQLTSFDQNALAELKGLQIFSTPEEIESFKVLLGAIDEELKCPPPVPCIEIETEVKATLAKNDLPDQWRGFDETGVFFNRLSGYCNHLLIAEKHSELLLFLATLPITIDLKRDLLQTKDPFVAGENKKFEGFRESLSVSERIKLYQAFSDASAPV